MTRRLLLTLPIDAAVVEEFADKTEFLTADDIQPETFRRLATDCDAIIVRAPLPDDIFDACPRLRAVVRHGAGIDMIPLEQANHAGVPVANVPGVNARSVAEHGVMQMLSLTRLQHFMRPLIAKGDWQGARAFSAQAGELGDGTVGIVGVGNVGQELARQLHFGFSMNVLGAGPDPHLWPDFIRSVELPDLLAESDYVVLCAPLLPETRGMIDAKALARMKPTAYLLNLGRGGLTIESDLLTALRTEKIAGAALDVFATQPLPPDHPFFTLPNVLVTPHVAGITRRSMYAMGRRSVEQALQILAGERPAHLVNPDVWDRRRDINVFSGK